MTSQRGEQPALPGGPGRWGGAGPPAPLHPGPVPGRCWGQRCHAGGPRLDPPLLSHARGGGGRTAPGPALAATSTCPSPTRLGQREKVPTLCLQPLALRCGPPGRAEPPLPPQGCFFPPGEMSPCGCGASHSDAPFSGSRLSFVWRINPTGLDDLRINPKPSEQSWFPALIPSPRCCRLEEKHHPG